VEEKVGRFLEWVRRIRSGGSDLGLRGEDIAVRELKRRGYEILDRRWRCRIGEIDVVARDGPVLVVIEVKTRSRADYGSPVNAVDARKRRKLERLARIYVSSRRLSGVNVRFDAVGVTAIPGKAPKVEIFPGALSF
jgi:putative endonuclease